MQFARFGVFISAALVTSTLVAPMAQAAPHIAPQASGSSFTSLTPTRVFDSRTTGHQLGASTATIVRFPANLVPADATAVVFNLTGTGSTGPTYLAVGAPGDGQATTSSNLDLAAGETRPNLVTSRLGTDNGARAVELWSGPSAVDAIVDVEGYYAPSTGMKFTTTDPHRVVDTRDTAPVGPGGTVTLDFTGSVPKGATSVVFNLTGTDATAPTFVTAYPTGQSKPDASNLNLLPGQTSPNLVTVPLGADGRVTLANAYGSVDLIADLAGYYGPQSTLAFFPLQPLRTLDTRDAQGNPREPLGPNGTHTVDFSGWLPNSAAAAVFTMTASNVTQSTFLAAARHGTSEWTTSNLNLAAGQTAANMIITALSSDQKADVFNRNGRTDVLVDLAGYFAAPTPACQSDCVFTWGMGSLGQKADGTTTHEAHGPSVAYGVSNVVATAQDQYHVYALKSDGTVWEWGGNGAGELTNGHPGGGVDVTYLGNGFYSTMPTQVLGLHDITAIVPGHALRSDGTVWSWGDNYLYELGNGATDPEVVPATAVQVSGLGDVAAIAGDDFNGYALKRDGTVWSWGSNVWGQLGDGLLASNLNDCYFERGRARPEVPNCASATPVQVVGLGDVAKIGTRLVIKRDGTVWEFGGVNTDFTPRAPRQVVALTGAVAVAGRANETPNETGYALMPDGTVRAWGSGGYGQLGNGGDCRFGDCPASAEPVTVSGLTGVTALAAGISTGYALRADGTVWVWGSGFNGALGDGVELGRNVSVPAQIAGLSGVTGIGNGGAAVVNPQ
ncbi:hypothetical protein [Kutzneria sp. 744]|uniref:RCC1 domain-containing protein n=1 Tax=Kutzneria sp. (strain 744) TaxID=345341 RepID=UPI0004B20F44|nr:hypothetical protein [Kutzneria sp. 744]